MTTSLWHEVHSCFAGNDVPGAVELLERYLRGQESQRFSCLTGLSFSNSGAAMLSEINAFVEKNNAQFNVKAIYLEMNGFDINNDRWYCDFFGYAKYEPDVDETDWLGDWQSGEWSECELLGLEPAQEAFAWYHGDRIWESQPEFLPVYEASMLLVMAKFAAFIGSSLKCGALIRPIPVLATAHNFESIARYAP